MNKLEQRRAFTIVELLVVVGIIIVIAALLYPAVTGAIHRAQTAKCAANQREIYQALMAYANDNNATIPAARGSKKKDGSLDYLPWYTWVRHYGLENWGPGGSYRNPALYCPVSGHDGSGPFSSHNPDYGLNVLVATDEEFTGGGQRRLVSLQRMSNLVLLADTGEKNNARKGDFRLLADDLISNGLPADSASWPRNFGFPSFRHPPHGNLDDDMTGGACNMLFCDGHVESVQWDDPRLHDPQKLRMMFDPDYLP